MIFLNVPQHTQIDWTLLAVLVVVFAGLVAPL
jgi:hypothetical protein